MTLHNLKSIKAEHILLESVSLYLLVLVETTWNKMSQLLSNESQVHPGASPDPLFQDGESAGSGSPMGSGNLVKNVFKPQQPLDTLTHKSNLNSPALAASSSLFHHNHHPRKLNEAVNYIHRDTLKSRGSQASLPRMRQPQPQQPQPHYVIENHYSTIHWHHPHHHVSRPRTHSIHN